MSSRVKEDGSVEITSPGGEPGYEVGRTFHLAGTPAARRYDLAWVDWQLGLVSPHANGNGHAAGEEALREQLASGEIHASLIVEPGGSG